MSVKSIVFLIVSFLFLVGCKDSDNSDSSVVKKEGNPLPYVGYVVKNTDTSILVVASTPSHDQYYEAIWVTTKELVDIGSKVEIVFDGEIMVSYPGKGFAKSVNILPSQLPKEAKLTAQLAAKQALAQVKDWEVPVVKEINYQDHVWVITLLDAVNQSKGEKQVIVDDSKEP